MMKLFLKILTTLALVMVYILVLFQITVSASDIDSAEYLTTISITNNSSSTASNVTVPFSLNTSAMIDGLQLSAAALDAVMRSSAGSDVCFMPGYGDNPWITFISSIAGYNSASQYLYTKGATGGMVRYFPGATGMSVPDGMTEPGNNYAWRFYDVLIDTVAGENKTIFSHYDVTNGGTTFVQNSAISDNIVFSVFDPLWTINPAESIGGANNYIRNSGLNYNVAHDAASGDALGANFIIGQQFSAPNYYILRCPAVFDTSAIPDDAVIISAILHLRGSGDLSDTDFDIVIMNGQPDYPHDPVVLADFCSGNYSGDGGSFDTVGFNAAGDNPITLNSDGLSWINKTGNTKFLLVSSRDISSTVPTGNEYITASKANTTLEIVWKRVLTASVTTGEHDFEITNDTTTTELYVNSVLVDSSENYSIPDSTAPWFFGTDNTTLYLASIEYDAGGAAVSSWEWEYGDTFHDSIGANDGTPTFRTTSSNADVSASVISMTSLVTGGTPTATTSGAWEMLSEAEKALLTATPVGLFSEGGLDFPGGPQIEETVNAFDPNMPVTAVLYILAIGSSITIGLVVMKITHKPEQGIRGSLILQAGTTFLCMVVWVVGGGGVISGWTLIPFGLWVAVALLARHPYNVTS